ncbi:MAG: NDP-sugar synthase [Deltaproteobacteria bacterium]|nr:NDP-sugar synthase [Deltaproteobacteria bacterium]
MKGFILAAGFGKRMLPITEHTPKPLLPVGNLPLIGYAIKLLAHHGITEVIVNVHHLAAKCQEYLGDGSDYGVKITYSVEEEILGTGGGLRRMREELSDSTFVVVNSDTLIDVDLGAAIEQHRESEALATMVVRQGDDQEDYGQIEIDEAGRIGRILGQGELQEGLKSVMFTGVQILEPEFLDFIPPDVETCIVRYGYIKALANGSKLMSFMNDGFWADAGTPERYFGVNWMALNQSMQLRHADPLGGYSLSPRKEVADVVRMGDDVELGQDARIIPPVLLGDGCRVGENATVGPYAIVGAKVQIGREAELSHCIIERGAKIGPGEPIAHAMIGKKGRLEISEK